MRKRIVIDIVLLIGAFIAPPWLVLTFALIGLLSFGNFYEIFAVGFVRNKNPVFVYPSFLHSNIRMPFHRIGLFAKTSEILPLRR